VFVIVLALTGGFIIFRLMENGDYNKYEWLVIVIAYAFLILIGFILHRFIKSEAESPKSHELTTILGVAVASIVQVAVTIGEFNFWNVIIGSVLIFILLTYPVTSEVGHKELLALAATWGFTVTLTAGMGLQELYKQSLQRYPGMPPLKNEEAPSIMYFIFWLIVSCIAYAIVDFGRSAARQVDKSSQRELFANHDPLK
jgi:hypothetical protein